MLARQPPGPGWGRGPSDYVWVAGPQRGPPMAAERAARESDALLPRSRHPGSRTRGTGRVHASTAHLCVYIPFDLTGAIAHGTAPRPRSGAGYRPLASGREPQSSRALRSLPASPAPPPACPQHRGRAVPASALAVAIDGGERGAFQCLFVGFRQ